MKPDSDILNRHVLLHNVPPEGPKRTLLACQTCRRRKIKCDSNEPCSTCCNLGVQCIRQRSSMQAANLTAIDYGINDAVQIYCDNAERETLGLGHSDNELTMCQNNGKDFLPFLVDNGAGWMAEASAILAENTTSEDISIPSFESSESVPTMTWSPPFNDQPENASSVPLSNALLDVPFQTSLKSFHKIWPHLHQSTIGKPPPGLLEHALQSLSHNNTDIRDTVNLDEVARRLLPSHPREQTSSVSLDDLQGLSVVLITTVIHEMTPTVANWATQWTEIAANAMRRLRMLAEPSWDPPDTPSRGEEEAWVCGEESKRLVYTMLRIDAYLSLITGRPPSFRVQEFELPLPVTESLWTASNIETRRQLYWFEPAGRTWTTLCSIVRDGLVRSRNWIAGNHTTAATPPLLPADSHLVLCAIQGDIWAAAQETHSLNHRMSDSRSSWRVPESVHLWHGCLVDWKAFHDRLGPSTTQIDDPAWNSLNQIQYHFCQLTLHAPLPLLESRQCCTRCRIPDITAMLHNWASSSEGRRAVYHASQLQSLHDSLPSSVSQYWLNPLHSPAVLASVAVLCNYAAENQTPSDGNPIELCQEEVSGLTAIEEWIQYGGPSMASGRMLCSSNLHGLFTWCQDQLAMFPQSVARLRALMAKL